MNLTSPVDGQILEYDQPTNTWINVNKPSGSGGIALTDLSSLSSILTYNNATGQFNIDAAAFEAGVLAAADDDYAPAAHTHLYSAISGTPTDLVHLAAAETLTNKTINHDNNTISNLPKRAGVSIVAPTSSEQIMLFRVGAGGATATGGNIAVRGTSPSVTYAVHYGATYGTSQGTVIASNAATSTGTVTINTAAIPANAYVWLATTAQSGTINEFTIELKYKE